MLDERLGLRGIDLEALADRVLVVVWTLHQVVLRLPSEQGVSALGGDVYTLNRRRTRAAAPAGQAPQQDGRVHLHQHHGFDRLAELFQHRGERVCLGDVAGKAVEDEAVQRVRAAQALADERQHDSSDTSAPASIAAFACKPRGVRRATASRNRSPEEIWGAPYLPAQPL